MNQRNWSTAREHLGRLQTPYLLTKPYDVDELLAAVVQACRGANLAA